MANEPVAPELILVCAIGPVTLALRYFPTLNGGKPNDAPYFVQSYDYGRWLTIDRVASRCDAVARYEQEAAKFEAIWGPRQLPQFQAWTTYDLPAPAYGYRTRAAEIDGVPA